MVLVPRDVDHPALDVRPPRSRLRHLDDLLGDQCALVYLVDDDLPPVDVLQRLDGVRPRVAGVDGEPHG